MRVVLAEPADRDLTGIIDYIALDNPKAAETVFDAIAAARKVIGRQRRAVWNATDRASAGVPTRS